MPSPQLLHAKVVHQRLFPAKNGFTYHVYYLNCPIDQLEQLNDGWRFGVNRRALLSLRTARYGAKDPDASLEQWLRGHLKQHHLNDHITDITLVTMPRALGYDFNPVSFWLCLDRDDQLRAVLCEVSNTFGETHHYLCCHDDQRPITADDWLTAEKLFHVSPFLPREGHYEFRFARKDDALGIWIDYYAANGEKQLLTSLVGEHVPYSRRNLMRAFWQIPAVAIKTIALIHYQALKLFIKKVRYVFKPVQREVRFSVTEPPAAKKHDAPPPAQGDNMTKN